MQRINPRLLPAKKKWSAPQRRTPEREVKITTPHKPHFSSCTRFLSLHSQRHLSVKTLAFVFSPQYFRTLRCAPVPFHVATAVLGKTSRGVSIPHSYTPHITLRGFCGYSRHFSEVISPSTTSKTHRNLLMINGQATPISLGGNRSRSMMSSSRPALPIPSAHVHNIVDPPTMQVESFRREVSLVQTHRMDLEEMQTFIFGLESQELNARNRISEELARCELEVQAEGLMITSMIESFQETSENERQAEIGAHKPPTTHRSEM